MKSSTEQVKNNSIAGFNLQYVKKSSLVYTYLHQLYSEVTPKLNNNGL